MKTKTDLDEKTICREYTETTIGVEALALKYHVGKKKIKSILNENGIEVKKRGKQPLTENFVVDWKTPKYICGDGYHYEAYDDKTDFVSADIDNKSGVLTTYIEKEYGVKTPTLYDRRKYYMVNGDYWWEQWLNVRRVENKPVKKCPYCDWETTDIDNRSGCFEQHLNKAHSKTKLQYISEFPDDKQYFDTVNPQVALQMETDSNEFVICKICGKKMRRIDNHHLKMHGMTKFQYMQEYGFNVVSPNYHKKQSVASINSNMNSPNRFTKHSKAEKEIINILEKNGIKCSTNRKILRGQEIDIYVPDLKIGIEYNGLYYHTESMGKDRNYHLKKTEECESKGVKLIHIFEDEYQLKKDIVLSKLLHIVGKNTNEKVYARKCAVKEILMADADDFLESNHIQGTCGFSVAYGLFYQDRLVAVMSFLNEGDDNWNLVRFASDISLHCIGAGGKLFKHFLRDKKPAQVKTFADRRWTTDSGDNLYTKLGFHIDHVLSPNYWYYKKSDSKTGRLHKFNFRKQKLSKKYGFPLTMTEREMTKELGYERIWDCGLIRYVYNNPDYLL